MQNKFHAFEVNAAFLISSPKVYPDNKFLLNKRQNICVNTVLEKATLNWAWNAEFLAYVIVSF